MNFAKFLKRRILFASETRVMSNIELTLFRQYVIVIFYDYLGHKELGEAVQRDDICPGLCSL